MIKAIAAALALTATLAGCAVGTAPGAGAVNGDYKIPVYYVDGYRAAIAQAERCLVGQGGYRVLHEIDEGQRKAVVRVVAPLGDGEMASVTLAGIDAKNSNVRISMWGNSIWNQDALRAMREAITYNLPSCTAFMPGDPQPTEEVWRRPAPR
ncbi:hypothetical protein CEG14_12095 [Bordetella genomosp. 1]|uniref:Lipoprotein n=1 Tax=Bordetella genomosp. 1 TaxID=1395607 RepID=A0A261SEG2_9BORD|nr:hypothetical protein [Bordetella genomosp. 1]MDQ8033998.1 hypothetical protein [Bordetella sp.]OZI35789.1 hypothetical protein CEG14_12095 [Bordetella genomosp. 1]OZI58453.1 hypothetical protein CAL27_17300 [Bordetella genomosp. 1]